MNKTTLVPEAFAGLLQEGWKRFDFKPFREGVEIFHLRSASPAVAFLRYAPGARIPAHRHTGLETVLVLEGAQSDERGDYAAGTFVLNPEGSVHSVWSKTGCVVLIQWERPVAFV